MNRSKNGSYDVFASPPVRAKHTVLIVDSEASSLQHVSMLLEQFDITAKTTTTARQGYERATAAPPSLIITALKLHDMHGLNFIKMLRRHPKTSDIPFIILRDLEDSLGEKHCFSAGAVDCLVKPVSAELLYRAIQGSLEDRPRAAMRYRTILPVWVDTVPFEGCEDVYTLDISEQGLFLRTPHPAPEHTRLYIRINLNSQVIKAEAKVIYACPPCKGPYQEPGNGLQFTHISRNDREQLRKFMRNELTRGHVPDNEMPYLLIDDIIL